MTTFRERVEASRNRVQKWRGEPALYTPVGGGSPIACTAFVETADLTVDIGGLPMIQTGRVAVLLRSEIAAPPARGDVLELLDAAGAVVASYAFTEDALSPDSMSLEWRCRVGEPAV